MRLLTREELRQLSPSVRDGRHRHRHTFLDEVTAYDDDVVPSSEDDAEDVVSGPDVIDYQRDIPYRVEYGALHVSQVVTAIGLQYGPRMTSWLRITQLTDAPTCTPLNVPQLL